MWIHKRPQNDESNPKKEKWNWKIRLPDFRLNYKATVIKQISKILVMVQCTGTVHTGSSFCSIVLPSWGILLPFKGTSSSVSKLWVGTCSSAQASYLTAGASAEGARAGFPSQSTPPSTQAGRQAQSCSTPWILSSYRQWGRKEAWVMAAPSQVQLTSFSGSLRAG